jgi:hypothetical protein
MGDDLKNIKIPRKIKKTGKLTKLLKQFIRRLKK